MKILVIEDNDDVRDVTLDALESEGFEAIGAENGRRGIELAYSVQPDLIICDIMMPEVDGYEVWQTLSEDLSISQIPFIYVTAKATWGDRYYSRKLGVSDYITKPFTHQELMAKVAFHLLKKEHKGAD